MYYEAIFVNIAKHKLTVDFVLDWVGSLLTFEPTVLLHWLVSIIKCYYISSFQPEEKQGVA